MLSVIHWEYRMKCYPSILVWPIQVHQHFWAMFTGSLSNKKKKGIPNIFFIIQMLLSICLKFRNASSNPCGILHFGMSNPNPPTFWAFSGRLSNSQKTVLSIFFYITTSTANFFENLEALPKIHSEYRMNSFPSALVWSIQIHQHF